MVLALAWRPSNRDKHSQKRFSGPTTAHTVAPAALVYVPHTRQLAATRSRPETFSSADSRVVGVISTCCTATATVDPSVSIRSDNVLLVSATAISSSSVATIETAWMKSTLDHAVNH